MLLIFPFVIFSLILNEKRRGDFIYWLCKCWALVWYVCIGVKHEDIFEATCTDHAKIYIGNHISYMDIPALVRSMRGSYRVLGKYEMVHYPIFGLIYRAAVVLVNRNDAEHRAKSFEKLKSTLQQKISIVIFPEGTFNEDLTQPLKSFYDGAFRIAIETQTNILPFIFIDTIDRFNSKSITSFSPGKSRVVYLPEINVQGYNMAQLNELKNHVYNTMDAALRRYRTYPLKA